MVIPQQSGIILPQYSAIPILGQYTKTIYYTPRAVAQPPAFTNNSQKFETV